MPAYLSVIFNFSRKNIYPDFMKDFYLLLDKCGVKYKRGFIGAESDTLKDIININQKKIEENFELGYDENYLNDYHQAYFEYGGFEEVRGYWLNRYPEEDEFVFSLIIPEHYFWDSKERCYDDNECAKIKPIVTAVWSQFSAVNNIQTCFELDDETSNEQLKNGEEPCARPYAVIPVNFAVYKSEKFETLPIERNGVIIRNLKF